jgi:DNA-binding IclR family transcriptional regulator
MASEEIKSHGIQSVEIAIEILKKIAEVDKPLSITEISNLCDMSKSKLHRYLSSFTRTGILEKSPETKYTLGTDLILLGLKASQKLNIKEAAAPYLMEIKETINETVALAIFGESGPFFISWEESNRPINLGIKVGSQVSITQSAGGMIFASFLPKEKVEKKVNQELLENGIEPLQFSNQLNQIKKNGYAFVNGKVLDGISAIACPIFDHSSNLVATIVVVGMENQLDTSPESPAVQLLKEKSFLLSKNLGWNGHYPENGGWNN